MPKRRPIEFRFSPHVLAAIKRMALKPEIMSKPWHRRVINSALQAARNYERNYGKPGNQ